MTIVMDCGAFRSRKLKLPMIASGGIAVSRMMDLGQTWLLVMAAAPPTRSLQSACVRLVFSEDRNLTSPPPPDEAAVCAEPPNSCQSSAVPNCRERITCRSPLPLGFVARQPASRPALVACDDGPSR